MKKITTINGVSKELTDLLSTADQHISITKDSYLFQQGEPVKELYVLLSGKIQIGKTSVEGKELTLRYCGAGDLIGELAFDAEEVNYLVDAKVMEEGEVAVIKQNQLRSRLNDNPELMNELLKYFNLQYRKDQTKFRDLVLYGKKGALYSTLIRLANSYGVKKANGIYLDVNLTNQEIANFCATSRESVNRMLNDLKRDNIIGIKKGKITIFQLNALKEAINCENCPVVLCSIN